MDACECVDPTPIEGDVSRPVPHPSSPFAAHLLVDEMLFDLMRAIEERRPHEELAADVATILRATSFTSGSTWDTFHPRLSLEWLRERVGRIESRLQQQGGES